MWASLATSAVAFISTNIDDIFILTLFYAQARDRKSRNGVFLGQCLGMGLLLAGSVLGAFGLQLVPRRWIGLLGLVPMALGVKAWRDWKKGEQEEELDGPAALGVGSVALVAIANGADNVGVYIPLFAGYSSGELAGAVVLFACMTVLWCGLGEKLGSLPAIRTRLLACKGWMVPVVFVALGVYILLENSLT